MSKGLLDKLAEAKASYSDYADVQGGTEMSGPRAIAGAPPIARAVPLGSPAGIGVPGRVVRVGSGKSIDMRGRTASCNWCSAEVKFRGSGGALNLDGSPHRCRPPRKIKMTSTRPLKSSGGEQVTLAAIEWKLTMMALDARKKAMKKGKSSK